VWSNLPKEYSWDARVGIMLDIMAILLSGSAFFSPLTSRGFVVGARS
jgi:hypothetical protein